MWLLIKLVGQRLPTGEIVFFRSLFALLPLAVYLGRRGELGGALRTQRLSGHFFRSGIGVVSMALNFAGLALLPLADVTAIFYAAPIFVVILAALLLHETVQPYRWAAVFVGFLGVLVATAPHLQFAADAHRTSLGAALSLGGALAGAIAMVQIRTLTSTERTGSIVLYFTLFSTLFGLLSLPLGSALGMPWICPARSDLPLLVGIGVLGGSGQILLTESYRLADASLVACFEYCSMLFAVALGYAVFGETPSLATVAGAAIVCSATLFAFCRERWTKPQLRGVRKG